LLGLPASIAGSEFLGAETVLTCVLGAAGAQLQARVPGHHELPAGTPARLKLPPRAHLFDHATGHRLSLSAHTAVLT